VSAPSRETRHTFPLPPGTALLRHGLRDGTWWWSDATYELHGFEVGEVVPTTELVLAHVHPDDRQGWRSALLGTTRAGTYSHVRLRDAQGRTRHVLGLVHREDDVVEAALVDVSAVVRSEGARVATEQIAAATTSRATIEQAKGMLASAFAVNPEEGFEMLRRASMQHNVTLRRLAELVVERAAARGRPVAELADELGQVLAPSSVGTDEAVADS
jgi:hypothetical protein